jgi:hypothetical protein
MARPAAVGAAARAGAQESRGEKRYGIEFVLRVGGET